MSDAPVGDVVLLNAVRQLASDARQAAALLRLDAPEHEFLAGVQHAAQRRLQPGLAAIEPPDLDRRSRPFQDGYLRATTLIGLAASGTSPLHFALPRYSAPGEPQTAAGR